MKVCLAQRHSQVKKTRSHNLELWDNWSTTHAISKSRQRNLNFGRGMCIVRNDADIQYPPGSFVCLSNLMIAGIKSVLLWMSSIHGWTWRSQWEAHVARIHTMCNGEPNRQHRTLIRFSTYISTSNLYMRSTTDTSIPEMPLDRIAEKWEYQSSFMTCRDFICQLWY